jgi:hypothetical protein
MEGMASAAVEVETESGFRVLDGRFVTLAADGSLIRVGREGEVTRPVRLPVAIEALHHLHAVSALVPVVRELRCHLRVAGVAADDGIRDHEVLEIAESLLWKGHVEEAQTQCREDADRHGDRGQPFQQRQEEMAQQLHGGHSSSPARGSLAANSALKG